MKCPKCDNSMKVCRVWGDQYSLKWNFEEDGKILGIWVNHGTKIGHGGITSRPYITSHRCDRCRIQMINEGEN